MTDFLTLAQTRRSIRAYAPHPVEDDKLQYILECARMAPSAMNRQPWHFYVVRSGGARRAVEDSYNRPWLSTAPLYIVVCADTAQAWVRGADSVSHALVDAAIAIEHICLAAADCGLGSCWVCNFEPDTLAQGLALPAGMQPVAIIPLGYSDGSAPRETSRKPLAETVTTL